MRRGTNPHKQKSELQPYKRHRIIVPIYIGANHEYFKQSDETLRLSLRTLFSTIDLDRVSVTVINNNSIHQVHEILEPYLASGKIDRYVVNQTNRGKPDAVAAEMRAVYEPFVTLTDCDVLFRHGWMRHLERVFLSHGGVGAVSPFPAPNHPFYKSATTWLAGALALKIRSGQFVEEKSIDEFLHSVGMEPDYFPVEAKRCQFKWKHSNCDALIGAGHFVIMFRTAAFSRFDYQPRLAGASNGEQAIDAEPDRRGYLRLSTPIYHVYHLGNAVESWMAQAVADLEADSAIELHSDEEFRPALESRRPLIGFLPFWIRRILFLPVHVAAYYYRKYR